MGTFLVKTIQLILSSSILIFIHEFGHVFFSYIFKVRVEKFYLFFNPWFSLFKYKSKKNGTEYGIGWLPLGGYAKIAGMIDESLDEKCLKHMPQSWEYRSKSVWARLFISVGGVLMNFCLSFFIYSIIVFQCGYRYIPIDKVPLFFCKLAHKVGFNDQDIILTANGKHLECYDDLDLFHIINANQVTVLRNGKIKKLSIPNYFKYQFIASKSEFADFQLSMIDSLATGSNAEKIGLKKDDKIVSVEGENTYLYGELVFQLLKHKNEKIKLKVKRGKSNLTFQVKVNSKGEIGIIPISQCPILYVHPNFIKSFYTGLMLGLRKISFYVSQLRLVFTKIGIKNIGGFGSVGKLFPDVWNWLTFWSTTAFLSIMLGIMNILPIPALDGGHVIFLLYEAIIGRKPNEKIMKYAQIIGIFFLAILLIYANVMDLIRLFFF